MQRMKPFRKRNPIAIGFASLIVIGLLLAASLDVEDLPLIGQGATYTARFSEAAGLQPDDDIRIAGVRVGKVTQLELDGNDVVVSFKAPDAWIGDRSSASIEIKTVLGQKYVQLEPAGDAPLSPDVSIPRERTRAPYDVITAFSDLSNTVQALNTDQLGQSLGVLSQTLNGATGPIRPALDGLSRLSQTISSRDQQLSLLLANTRATTQVLADRDGEIQRILSDGNLLLGELRARKQSIDALLDGVQVLSAQLSGLVADNQATLRPALEQVNGVLTTLQQNSANLENGLRNLAPFYRVFANVVGSGRWFDAYICNLDPPLVDPTCNPQDTATEESLLNQGALTSAATNGINRLGVPLLQQALQNPLVNTAGAFGGQLPTIPGVTLPPQAAATTQQRTQQRTQQGGGNR